jgi:hypothetical protein
MTPEQFVWFVAGVVQAEKDKAIQEATRLDLGVKPADIQYIGSMKTILDALDRVEMPDKKTTAGFLNRKKELTEL